jgi:hypothetical protein
MEEEESEIYSTIEIQCTVVKFEVERDMYGGTMNSTLELSSPQLTTSKEMELQSYRDNK